MMLTEMVDFPVIDKVNAVGGALVVLASYIFGEHWVLFAAFLALNMLDYLTGTMKGRLLKIESSSAGLKGIVKKFSYWIMIVISFGMCPILNEIGTVVDADLSPFSPFIGWFTLASLMINELRSVLENLVESGVKVPGILIKGFRVAEKTIQKSEEIFDGSLNIDANSKDGFQVDIQDPPEKLAEKSSITLKIHTISDDEE